MKHLGRTLGLAFLFSLKTKLLVCTVLIVYCMCVSVWVDKLTCRPSGRSLSPLSALRWSAARRSWRGQRSRTAGGTEHEEDLSYCRSAAYDLQQEVCQDCIQDSRIIPSCVCGSSRTCSDDLGDDVQISLHVFVAQVLKRPRGRETSSKSKQQSSRFMFRLAGSSSGFQDSELMIRSVTTFLKCVASFCEFVFFRKSLVPEIQ